MVPLPRDTGTSICPAGVQASDIIPVMMIARNCRTDQTDGLEAATAFGVHTARLPEHAP